ncbi:hypothetical protein FEQ05_05084 [Burkholderia pseudomultivorans]|uniref:DUF2971 domain-containing protein n=2 Tax=Burkholderiaceae TaxID=119060 RepID=A0ABU2ED93_9BURK|nr:hypothetical protein [Burkholderia pseudomultivorans]TCT27284.1 DUF2971 family protein [Burkholderia vietnamiensis]MDR8738731.1 hypothetical protein [Burkholderia pseudomultivorans]MDR8745356.1 hypothetical protein [Burkholderia pseudomultivorans]MDR8757473.1 hypothetical protein [Burkholderia pseudomultivorans]
MLNSCQTDAIQLLITFFDCISIYTMKNFSGRLYRIINFHHAVQIFEKNEIFFSSPSSWEDPYETRLVYRGMHRIFAQCWCSNGISDAMWRIYSPNHLGVRIGTSTKKLAAALKADAHSRGIELRMEDVTYHSQRDLNLKSRKIKDALAKHFDTAKATDFLFMKREAYEHEAEFRVVAIAKDQELSLAEQGLRIKVSPKSFIDSILIDPRAPDELANALIYYFKEKVGFKKKCRKSVLYKTPQPLMIEP